MSVSKCPFPNCDSAVFHAHSVAELDMFFPAHAETSARASASIPQDVQEAIDTLTRWREKMRAAEGAVTP